MFSLTDVNSKRIAVNIQRNGAHVKTLVLFQKTAVTKTYYGVMIRNHAQLLRIAAQNHNNGAHTKMPVQPLKTAAQMKPSGVTS